MPQNKQKIGWIGMGRMGYPMAERLLDAGYDVSIWNRTQVEGRAARQEGRQDRRQSHPSSTDVDVLFSIVSTGKDVEEVYFGKNGVTAAAARRRRCCRLLDHRGRGIRHDPQTAQAARQRLRRLSGERQRQGDQGRQAVRGRVRTGSRVPQGRADDPGVRAARRLLRGRGRARARVQDRPQRDARRGDREPDRDHAADQQDGRAAPRLPGLPQQRRDGLDVHRLQVARAGEPRLDHHVHARAAAQGSRPRPRARAARTT